MHRVHNENSTRNSILSRLRNKPSETSTSENLKNGIPTKFEPACLLEKRKDDETPINILLLLPNVCLGKSYVKALKDYKKISKLHASLTYINGSWYIKDFKSANGVFLNFRKIKGPTKVNYWSVIGLGGNYISEGVFTGVLCPLYKEFIKILPRIRTDIYPLEYKLSSKTNSSDISKEDSANSIATSIPTEFKPAILLEKRSDNKTIINIPLTFPNVTLGKGYIKDLKYYKKVSNLHASLSYVNGSWFIRDFGSANGVFLNLKKIGENPVKVDFWSVIGLGGSCISDDVFTCVLCPYYKTLAENVTSINTINYLKDKESSKTSLRSKVAKKKDAKSCSTSSSLKKHNSDSFHSRKSKCTIYPIESKKSLTASQVNENKNTCFSHLFDTSNKIKSHLSSMKTNSEKNGDLCEGKVEDKALPEFSQVDDDDDDAKSTTSSVESMDIIMYPSASVLSNIEKSRKMGKYHQMQEKVT